MYYVGNIMCDPNYLEHHGIEGMRWGYRRFQDKNGRLTPEGKKRYGLESQASSKGAAKAAGVVAGIAGAVTGAAHIARNIHIGAAAKAAKEAASYGRQKWVSGIVGAVAAAVPGPGGTAAALTGLTGAVFLKSKQIGAQVASANHMLEAIKYQNIRTVAASNAAVAGASAVAAMLNAKHKKRVYEESKRNS